MHHALVGQSIVRQVETQQAPRPVRRIAHISAEPAGQASKEIWHVLVQTHPSRQGYLNSCRCRTNGSTFEGDVGIRLVVREVSTVTFWQPSVQWAPWQPARQRIRSPVARRWSNIGMPCRWSRSHRSSPSLAATATVATPPAIATLAAIATARTLR